MVIYLFDISYIYIYHPFILKVGNTKSEDNIVSFVDRYVLRVQGMQLRLEFVEKKEELKPALDTLHKAIDGNVRD